MFKLGGGFFFSSNFEKLLYYRLVNKFSFSSQNSVLPFQELGSLNVQILCNRFSAMNGKIVYNFKLLVLLGNCIYFYKGG